MSGLAPRPGEGTPWPYGKLAAAHDAEIAGVRRLVERTEDGYYGFALKGDEVKLSMVGPVDDPDACLGALRTQILRAGLQDR